MDRYTPITGARPGMVHIRPEAEESSRGEPHVSATEMYPTTKETTYIDGHRAIFLARVYQVDKGIGKKDYSASIFGRAFQNSSPIMSQ